MKKNYCLRLYTIHKRAQVENDVLARERIMSETIIIKKAHNNEVLCAFLLFFDFSLPVGQIAVHGFHDIQLRAEGCIVV